MVSLVFVFLLLFLVSNGNPCPYVLLLVTHGVCCMFVLFLSLNGVLGLSVLYLLLSSCSSSCFCDVFHLYIWSLVPLIWKQGVINQFKGTNLLNSLKPLKQLCFIIAFFVPLCCSLCLYCVPCICVLFISFQLCSLALCAVLCVLMLLIIFLWCS